MCDQATKRRSAAHRRRPAVCGFCLLCFAPWLATVALAAEAPISAPAPSIAPGRVHVRGPHAWNAVTLNRASRSALRGCNPGQPSAADITPEIESLAHALNGDVCSIYEYVRNNIDYVPTFGATKGATMTLVDRAGNDGDQASLLIALLRASGHSARYAAQRIVLTLEDVAAWLGVPADPAIVGQVLFAGGIGGDIVEGGPGQPTRVHLSSHIWVAVDLEGTTYVFDPSYKHYQQTPGIDLAAASGYDATALMNQAWSGATGDSVSIQNVNTDGVHDLLRTYADNLVGYLRSHHPADSVETVVGARKIIPVHDEPFQTSLPYQEGSPGFFDDYCENWTVSELFIDHRGIYAGLPAYVIYGKRLTISDNAAGEAELRLDGELLATGTTSNYGDLNWISLRVDHASTWNEGTYLDQDYETYLRAGGSYVIMNNWGPTGREMIERHRRKLQDAVAAGLGTGSEEVWGETLAMTAAMYFAEGSAYQRLSDLTRETLTTNHYTVGFCGLKSGIFFDIPMSATAVVSLQPSSPPAVSDFFAQAGIGSALEWGVIEQAQEVEAVSTINLLTMANEGSQRIFDASLDNYYLTVRPLLIDYEESILQLLDAYIDAGYRLILPEVGNNKVGYWRGAGFLVVGPGDSSIGHLIGGGGLIFGGSAIYPGDVYPFGAQRASLPGYREKLHAQSDEPIDLVTGAYLYSHRDLTVGSGPYPFSLPFERYYNSASRHTPGTLGRGWTHNFDIQMREGSDGFQGLGEDSAIEAAACLVADHAARDVLAVGLTLDRLVIATICQKWFQDRLLRNTLIVDQPGYSRQFVRLADGSYNPPPGDASELGSEGMIGKHGTVMTFLGGQLLWSWRDRQGNSLAIVYSSVLEPPLLESVSNGMGQSLSFSYEGNRLTRVSDHTGRSVAYEYDAEGNLTSATSVDGHDTVYEYDLPGRLTKIFFPTDPAAAFVTNTFDGADRITTQTNASGHIYQYRLTGSQSQETDPLGNTEVLEFDSRGRTVRRLDRSGRTTTYAYDGQDRLIGAVYPEGNSVEYAYDAKHNLTSTRVNPKPESPLVPITRTYSYEPVYQLVAAETDAVGRTSTYTYDSAGNLTAIERPALDGIVPRTTIAYNARGQITTWVDPVGRTTSQVYDGATGTLLSTVIDPGGLNLATSFTYDSLGNMISRTDGRGNTTAFQYDANRRLIQVTTPSPFLYATRFAYDLVGRLISRERQRDEAGTSWHTFAVSYTPTGKRASVTNAAGQTTRYEYNALDSLAKEINPAGNETEYHYDELGRLTRVTDPLGHIAEERTYTPNGKTRSLRGASDALTSFEYDGLDRIAEVLYPDASFVSYDYDATGNRIAHRTRAGDVLTFAYDALDRMIAKAVPGGGATTYSYDLSGRAVEHAGPNGSIRRRFDQAGRLVEVAHADGSAVAYRWDAAGNRTALVYPDGYAVSYDYDELNRLTDMTAGAANPLVDYDSDDDVDLQDVARFQACFAGPTQPVLPLCAGVDLDGNGRVDSDDYPWLQRSLTGPQDGTAKAFYRYAYDALSRRTEVVYDNGTSITYTYDSAGRLVNVANHMNPTDRTFNYTLDALGRRQTMTVDGAQLHTYAYDAAHRLVTADFPADFFLPDTSIALDPAGNRISVVGDGATIYQSNNLNQYTAVDGVSFTYDLNGNLTADGSGVYTYDAENRLRSAATPAHAASYEYDALGRRVSKSVDGVTSRYVLSGADVLMEWDEQGQVIRRFVHGPGIDEPIRVVQAQGTYHFHYDGLGSVIALSDADGREVESYAYGPFGEHQTPSALGNVRRFAAREWDEETGLYYQRARHYHPPSGRFMQTDPLGVAGGINLYAYADNDPVNAVDPTGLDTYSIGFGIEGGSALLLGLGGGGSLVFMIDDHGNAGFSFTPQGGGHVGHSVGGGITFGYTNAETIWDTSGRGSVEGGSVFVLGVEDVYGGDYMNPSYTGTNVSIGLKSVGLPVEVHSLATYSYVAGWDACFPFGCDDVWGNPLPIYYLPSFGPHEYPIPPTPQTPESSKSNTSSKVPAVSP